MSNTKTNTEWSSREVGAFWKNKGRTTGQTYLSGHITMEDEETGAKRRVKLVVFPNKFKEENEKICESDCMLFLHQTFEPIASKIRLQEYESLYQLTDDMKEF